MFSLETLFSQIYLGCLNNAANLRITTEEYQDLAGLFTKRENTFQQSISEIRPDLNEQYERLMGLNLELASMKQEEAFKCGLSLGLLLMAESLRYNLK